MTNTVMEDGKKQKKKTKQNKKLENISWVLG